MKTRAKKAKAGVVRAFNKLSPAEAERLAMLAEEAGEIVQAMRQRRSRRNVA